MRQEENHTMHLVFFFSLQDKNSNMKSWSFYGLIVILILPGLLKGVNAQNTFIRVKDGRFIQDGLPFYFVGTNYWYGAIQGISESGKSRVREELDFLKSHGVNNLRVLAAVEGSGPVTSHPRVEPAYQPEAGKFRDELLTGLDFLLAEMGKRQLTAVIMLSNNWEWSGGFLQYLHWNGQLEDSLLRKKMEWEDMRDYISRFYACTSCIQQYQAQVKNIVTRVNTITGKKYSDDPAIMSWEIANEPRPMRPYAVNDYKVFIKQASSLIRTLDPNHLITTGSEGYIGSESVSVFRSVHQEQEIDYLTIHIWPKNWGWFRDTSIADGFNAVLQKTKSYIRKHQRLARVVKKPLVLEEFGLPRDGHSYALSSTTGFRDQYFRFIFSLFMHDVHKGGPVAGANFWAFGGIGRPSGKSMMWQKGDDWLGDPPMEEQGLNTVFDQDHSTWILVSEVAAWLKSREK